MANVAELAQTLLARRTALGATLAQVADWSGLDEAVIEQIELGDQPPTTSQFERLCLGLGVAPDAVYRGTASSPKRSVARFRSATLSEHPHSEDVRLLALAAELGRVMGRLLERLGREPGLLVHRQVTPLLARSPVWEQGYKLGEHARGQLTSTTGRLPSVEQLLASCDVHVANVGFVDKSVDAASIREPGAMPIVLLNAASPRVRFVLSRRAVLAHELCHLLFDGDQEEDLVTRLSWNRGSSHYGDDIEARARAFAPAFLAPRSAVQIWARRQPDLDDAGLVVGIAREWGLSVEGALWHAKNADVISAESAERINRCRPAMGPDTPFVEGDLPLADKLAEHGFDVEDLHGLMAGQAAILIAEALDEEIISHGRARELLRWS